MTAEQRPSPDLEQLQGLAELREHPFHSDVPVLGGLIAWFRTVWNSVATKWYVRPMMAQQTEYNQAVLDRLRQIESRTRQMQLLAEDLDARVRQQDRQYTMLVHDLGQTTARIVQLRAMLQELEEDTAPTDGAQP